MQKNNSNRIWILAGLGIADLLGAIDSTGVAITLPRVARDFSVSVPLVQWVVNSYTLVLVVLMITVGRVGDVVGYKKLYIWGLVLFGLGSLLSGTASGIWTLIAARTIQGAGTAVLYTMPASIIAHLWKNREKAFAFTAGLFSLGLLLGPVLGGLFTNFEIGTFSGWHLLYLLNLPIVLFGLIVSSRLLPDFKGEGIPRKTDFLGLVLLSLGMFALVFGLVNQPFITWFYAGLFIISVLLLVELRQKNSLIDFRLFKNRTFLAANLVSFLAMVSVTGLSFVNSFYLQDTLGWSPWEAGRAMLPIPAAMLVFAFLGGRIRNWKIGAFSAALLLFVSLMILSRISPQTGYFMGLFPAYIIAGAGGGLLMTMIFSAVLGSAPVEESGTASGLLNTIQQIGALIGVTAVVAFVDNYKLAFGILAWFAFIAVACSLFISRKDAIDVSKS